MRKAIIIGATSGIGREVAVRLVKEGWQIGITGRRKAALAAFGDEYGPTVHTAAMDVTKPEATESLDHLIEEMGAPDLFFYVSGIGYQNRELDLDREIRTVQTNCEGMVRMVDHFISFVRAHPEIYDDAHKAHIAVITSGLFCNQKDDADLYFGPCTTKPDGKNPRAVHRHPPGIRGDGSAQSGETLSDAPEQSESGRRSDEGAATEEAHPHLRLALPSAGIRLEMHSPLALGADDLGEKLNKTNMK